MPFFGRGQTSVPIDPEFEAAIVASTDADRASTHETLGRNFAAVQQLMAPDEKPVCVCWYNQRVTSNMLLVVTNRRSLTLHKSHVIQQLSHDEVAETTSWSMTNADGTLVRIESERAQLDYRADDPDRMQHIIQVEDVTPRVAAAISAAIAPYLGGR
jgi:hypothetical protein